MTLIQSFLTWYRSQPEQIQIFIGLIAGAVIAILGSMSFPLGVIFLIPGIVIIVVFAARFIVYMMRNPL